MIWYYYGKDVPTAKLAAMEILKEWYALCEEDGLDSVRPHRAHGSRGGEGSGQGSGEGSGCSGGGARGNTGRKRAPFDSPAAADEDGRAEVNAAQDAGHFARFGRAPPQARGAHAGVYLGVTRM